MFILNKVNKIFTWNYCYLFDIHKHSDSGLIDMLKPGTSLHMESIDRATLSDTDNSLRKTKQILCPFFLSLINRRL